MTRALALALLLPAFAAQADCLSPVRAALQGMTGATPIKASLERSLTSERKDRVKESGRVSLRVEAGADGIRLLYPAALLERIRSERAQTDPEQPQPTLRAIEGFDAIDVAALMNAAPGLLSEIDGATCKAASEALYRGRPARLLELDLRVRTSRANGKWLKRATSTMKLWVGADQVPLGAESTFTFRAGFLVFNFDGQNVETHDYVPRADRLVALRYGTTFDGEGLGERQHTASSTDVKLEPGA